MKFLVYTADPLDEYTTLDSFEPGADRDITRILSLIKQMDLDRVVNNHTVSVLVENVEYDKEGGMVTADIYKQTSQSKALHQLAEDGGEITIQEIISKHDDAFIQGVIGAKKVDGDVHILVEKNFGSFFAASTIGMDLLPQYSSDTIQAIQESETIGKTTLDFHDDYDLTASLFKPPEDEDLREENGLGSVNIANKLTNLLNISRAHRMSMNIDRDEWLANVEIFDELVKSGIVATVRVEETSDGVVRLGEGGDRAIRETVKTARDADNAVEEALMNLSK